MKYKLHLSRNQICHILMVIIPIICLYCISSIVFTNLYQIKHDVQVNINRLETTKKDNIKYIIENRIHQAELQNKFISNAMIKKLTNNDKRQLINDMENDTISNNSSHILANTVIYDMRITQFFNTKEPDHILFISNTNGIIDIENIDTDHPNAVLRKWTEISSKKINRPLTENAIFNLVSNNHKFIYWESDMATYSGFKSKYNESSKEEFYKIIDTTKTEDLINYNILVPIYINLYDNDDENYNFIIVREINVYSSLTPFIYDIDKYNFIIDEYKYNMNALSFITSFIGIIISLLLLGCILLGISRGGSSICDLRKTHRTDGGINDRK